MMQKIQKIVVVGVMLLLLASGSYGTYQFVKTPPTAEHQTQSEYTAFALDVYDTIFASYWNNIEERALADFYKRVGSSLLGHTFTLNTADRAGVASALERELFAMKSDAERKDFVVKLSANILQGLEPVGRSGLYTKKNAQNLADRVNNVDANKDLYGTLGVEKSANTKQIAAAGEARKIELKEKAKTDETAKKELAEVTSAEEILTDNNKKERYDSIGALPTVFVKRLSPDIVHLYISQFSPSTYDEFVHALKSIDLNPTPSSLILDLRGNIGGSLDIVPYMLGPLIGPGNYAFSLYSKKIQDPITTQTGWLDALKPYKKIVILIDNGTQSSGEVFASTLKKYNVGLLVGVTTRGWGTVEKVFPIEHQIDDGETYGLFLVHSITLGDDNQPIEGRGISPDIDISTKDWQSELRSYGYSTALSNAVNAVWNKPAPKN